MDSENPGHRCCPYPILAGDLTSLSTLFLPSINGDEKSQLPGLDDVL